MMEAKISVAWKARKDGASVMSVGFLGKPKYFWGRAEVRNELH